jgi:hypothetical protein
VGEKTINVELKSNYIFKDHTFSNIKIKILNNNIYSKNAEPYELNGIEINIIPEKIFVKNLELNLKDLVYYIQAIRENFNPNARIIKIDLNLKKVFIDSNSFNVNINN